MASKVIGIEEVTENKGNIIWRAILAEFLGNLLLNVFGCTTAIMELDRLKIALCFGLTIYILVQTLGHVSGGHFNPAVSVAMFVTGNIGLIKLCIYVIAQCAGAIAGSAIVLLLARRDHNGNYGHTNIDENLINSWQGVGYEFLLGFILVIVVFGFCDPDKPNTKYTGSLAVGCAIAVGHMAFIEVTGSSMNPARTLGSAVIANEWNNHWVYWVGPICGGVCAALLYRWIFQMSMEYGTVSGDEGQSTDRKQTA